ncbi:MAG: glycine cleavage system protein R [Blastochloris sp.]|nr:glycine cleavage system protein R [Blastochloris sp.]
MSSLILTVIGPDKPGLIEALASVVAGQGGNWLESRMTRLGGQFAGIVHVQISKEQHPGLIENLDTLQARGLTVSVFADGRLQPPSSGMQAEIEWVGNDRPGIVNQISHALAEYQVNVEELHTEVLSAPMAGGQIFQARAKVRLPENCQLASLRRQLEEVASDLQVDIRFQTGE